MHYQERALRNHLEHLDQRFEQWWLDDPHHNMARRNLGSVDAFGGPGLAKSSMFELFDPDKYMLAFQGDFYELRPVTAELSRLTQVCKELMDKPTEDWA